MRRRLLAATVLLLVLTACAPGPEDPQSPLRTPTPGSPTPTAASSTVDPSQASSVTLQLWLPAELGPSSSQPGAAVLTQQLDQFVASSAAARVDVTMKADLGEESLLSFLVAASSAAPSVLPDLAAISSADLKTAFDAGLLQPLDGLLAQERLDDQFDFAAQLTTIEGEQVAFVLGAEILHAAYRPARVASPPVSWTLVLSGRVSYLFPAAGQDGQVNEATLLQYLAAGGELTDTEGNAFFDAEPFADVLDFYRACVVRGAVAPATVLAIEDADDAWDRFVAGEGALSVVHSRRYWLEADESMAPVQLPTRDGSPSSLASGWVIILITDSPTRQAAAKALIEWLTEPGVHAAWTSASGYLPATNEGLAGWDVSAGDRTVLRALLESAAPRPAVAATTLKAMQEALEAVLQGEESPAEAAEKALQPAEP
ncbi:MAG: extracellular solute-binding protein [Anaerolineales bacterium]|nr:MAG: extracellular solute-binding protein [Anaerolineales bacterium]